MVADMELSIMTQQLVRFAKVPCEQKEIQDSKIKGSQIFTSKYAYTMTISLWRITMLFQWTGREL